MKKDIEQLPNNSNNQFSECQKYIREAFEKIQSLSVEELISVDSVSNMRVLLDALLEELSDLLHETSLSISNTYFNHMYQQNQLINKTNEAS